MSDKVAIEIDYDVIDVIMALNETFYDSAKIAAWLNTKNYNFGNIAPVVLIKKGKVHKVIEFIRSTQDLIRDEDDI